jgi:NADH:ubiquinone oxidoreductase subunit H
MRFLFFLCLIGVLVYFMLLMGFYRKSKYSILGAIRARCQRISFEVVFFFFLFFFFLIYRGFMICFFFRFYLILLLPSFFIIILVELNRPPFDFSEGESELVRGFNLEFGSIFFVLLFLGEYGFLIFFRVFISCLFFFGWFWVFIFFFSLFLFIRSSYSRYRYDLLMG